MSDRYHELARAALRLSGEPLPRHVNQLARRLARARVPPDSEPYSREMIEADFGRDDDEIEAHEGRGSEYTLDPVLAVRALLLRPVLAEATIKAIASFMRDYGNASGDWSLAAPVLEMIDGD